MIRKILLILAFIGFSSGLIAQQLNDYPPLIKGYKGSEGKVIKKYFFNFIKLKDEAGVNERQATGRFWEINYVYDSIFRQKELFANFMKEEISRNKGVLFFQDTSQIHFAIPRDDAPNIWGKVTLKSDRIYRVSVIEEIGFENQVVFDSGVKPKFEEFVEAIELPERMGYMPATVVTSARYSKFNHYRITFVKESRSHSQILMGPYWDLKCKVVDSTGETDSRISSVQIMESYFRSAVKLKGNIIKSKPRELIFNIPVGDDQKLWVRVMTSLNGLYYLKMVLQNNADEQASTGAIDTTKKKK